MDGFLQLEPNGFGMLAAALAVAAGAPVFSDGLRALRLRRSLAHLEPTTLGETTTGVVHAQGEVALESPLFAPLSAAPCAGYTLVVHGIGTRVARSITVRRPFRLMDEGLTARVLGETGRWELSSTGEREVSPAEPLTENLRALLERVPELTWLRRRGRTLAITEHALVAGTSCHVVGFARHARPFEVAGAEELLRTGTDNAITVASTGDATFVPDLLIDPGDHLDYLLISDEAPTREQLSVPAIKVAGIAIGPALGLLGLLYLARAGDALLARRVY